MPICGGGICWNAGRLNKVPVWAFHGGKDDCVEPGESQRMVDSVKRFGGSARLTIYPEAGHNAWDATYSNPEVYAWLLEHRNAGAEASQKGLKGPEIYG